MTKEELIQQTKLILTQIRHFTPEEIFVVESSLENKDITLDDLQKMYDSMIEFKKEQDSAYAEFKTEMIAALDEYAKAVTPAPTPQAPK